MDDYYSADESIHSDNLTKNPYNEKEAFAILGSGVRRKLSHEM